MAAQLCGAGAPPDIVQSVLIELDHGATSNSYLASKKVLDLGEDASSFSGLLEAAAARFKVPALVPAVTWVYDGGPAAASLPAVSITSDHDLAALLATLRGPVAQGGHFRFQPTKTLNTDGAPTSNSGCCGNKGGSDSKASLSTLEDPAAVPAVLSEQALQLVVNGKPIVVQSPPPSLLLVDFLRDTLKLTGTKIGCGEGGCGACTVTVKPIGSDDAAAVPINACLRLLCACDGLAITTVEGLGSEAAGFSEVQLAIADGNGSQCGYCTPGWVVNMSALLDANPKPTPYQVEQHFDGNLCRCTGYRPILEAFKGLADAAPEPAAQACRTDLNHCGDMEDLAGRDPNSSSSSSSKKATSRCCKTRAPAVAPVADPGAAMVATSIETSGSSSGSSNAAATALSSSSGDQYHRPGSVASLVVALNSVLRESQRTLHLVAGNTGMGVAKYYLGGQAAWGQPPEGNVAYVDLSAVSALRAIAPSPCATPTATSKAAAANKAPTGGIGSLRVGSAVTVSELVSALQPWADGGSVVYQGVVRHLMRVANTQVRGAATWGGNLAMTSSCPTFASDVAVVCLALGVELEVMLVGPNAKASTMNATHASTADAAIMSDNDDVEQAVLGPLMEAGEAISCMQRARACATTGATTKETGVDSVVRFRCSMDDYLANGGYAMEGCATVLLHGHFLAMEGCATDGSNMLQKEGQRVVWYSDKTAQRHCNAHAIVNFAGLLTLAPRDVHKGKEGDASKEEEGGGEVIVAAQLSCGGLLARPSRLLNVEKTLVGACVGRESTLQRAIASLRQEVRAAGGPDNADSADSAAYQESLAVAFLYKLMLTAQPPNTLPPELVSAAAPFAAAADRPVSTGAQKYAINDWSTSPVGQPVPKLSARLQASGEARYASDLPAGVRQPLWASFVLATKSQVQYEGLDESAALKMAGVVRVLNSSHVPGSNRAPGFQLFLEPGDHVDYVGAPVALVVADSFKHARAAAKTVALSYAPAAAATHEGAVVGPELATARDEFLKGPLARRLGRGLRRSTTTSASSTSSTSPDDGSVVAGVEASCGDVESVLANASTEGLTTVAGRLNLGGQKHFYMETMAAVAVPDEDRRVTVTCGTQYGEYSQKMVAAVLGLPLHRVTVNVRRVGGAYGGKITQTAWTDCASAMAAVVLQQPVAMHNERGDDMTMLGGRESMEVTYHCAVTSDTNTDGGGYYRALDMFFSLDGGSDAQQAVGSLAMATGWSDGCYYAPNFRAKGAIRHSARAPNTSCRAPGNLQSITVRELVNEHVAWKLGLTHLEVQERNMYASGQTTPFGDVVGSAAFNWTVPTLWSHCKEAVAYDLKLARAKAFNAANRYRKRGICLVPTKYGMTPSGYKMGALVNIYAGDGTVEVSHSGSELGQGINTKVAQAVAMALNCPLDDVIVGTNSTATVPNGGCTGGSGTSESVVGAALNACKELNATLDLARANHAAVTATAGAGTGAGAGYATMSMADAAAAAASAGMGLSATGWFNEGPAAPDGSFDYATQGVGFAEVEIDCLTGELQILQMDIHMDLGTSLNPAIDIGQLEGGLVMALGCFLTEEMLWSSDSLHAGSQVQVNLGTWNYKPMSAFDIPQVLNVTLLPGAPNPSPAAVLSSKAQAEPAMALAAAVVLAVKAACAAGRESLHGDASYLNLDLPLTVERVQQACRADRALRLS